jgi:cytochrome c553
MRPTTLLGLALLSALASATVLAQTTAASLKSPSDFGTISDQADRSRALFAEMGKVIESPRCQNCHPVGQRPTQADDMHPHLPLVVRGADDQGAIAMRCATCHQAANFAPAGVPGAPKWHMAPVEMAWQGKSLGQICEQIKDPARNGKRTLAQIHDHMAFDELVGWGWHPGGTRTPAPGTQKQFGELVAAWIQTGAACPAP